MTITGSDVSGRMGAKAIVGSDSRTSEKQESSKLRKYLTGAVLVSSLVGMPACGSRTGLDTEGTLGTTTNNEYDAGTGPVKDSGAQDAAADAAPGADSEAGSCKLPQGGGVVACPDKYVSGYLYTGETLPFNNLGIPNDAIEYHAEGNQADLRIVDQNCVTVTEPFGMHDNEAKTVSVGGVSYKITASEILATGDPKTSKVSLKVEPLGCDLDGGVEADAGQDAPVDSGSDAPLDGPATCWVPSSGSLTCDNAPVNGTLVQGKPGFVFGTNGIGIDGAEDHNGVLSAIVSIYDSACKVIKKDKVAPNITETFVLNGQSFDISVGSVALENGQNDAGADASDGSVPAFATAYVDIRPSSCGECLPKWSCNMAKGNYVYHLGEGESFDVNGGSLQVESIDPVLGAPQGGTCPVVSETAKVMLTMQTTYMESTLGVNQCSRTNDGCYSLRMMDITETVGAASGSTCPASDEKVLVQLRIGN